jgi:hypothetical protein
LWIYLFVLEDYLCSCGIPFEVVTCFPEELHFLLH